MTPAPAVPSPLSPHWAFVVQFRLGADVAQGPCMGRVEHVVSGQATHFASLEDLQRIVTTMSPEWGQSLTA